MGCEGAIIHRDLENRGGRTPKTLRFSRFWGFGHASRLLRCSREGAGLKRGDFRGGAARLKRFALPPLGYTTAFI